MQYKKMRTQLTHYNAKERSLIQCPIELDNVLVANAVQDSGLRSDRAEHEWTLLSNSTLTEFGMRMCLLPMAKEPAQFCLVQVHTLEFILAGYVIMIYSCRHVLILITVSTFRSMARESRTWSQVFRMCFRILSLAL